MIAITGGELTIIDIRLRNGLTTFSESYSMTITTPNPVRTNPINNSRCPKNPPITLTKGINNIPISNKTPAKPAAAANPSGNVSLAAVSSNFPVRCFLFAK